MPKVINLIEKRKERNEEMSRVFTAASEIVMNRFTPEQQKEIIDTIESKELRPSEFTGIAEQFVLAVLNESNNNPDLRK